MEGSCLKDPPGTEIGKVCVRSSRLRQKKTGSVLHAGRAAGVGSQLSADGGVLQGFFLPLGESSMFWRVV